MQGDKPEREKAAGREAVKGVMVMERGFFNIFIFGSKTADAEMQVNVYSEWEKAVRTISDRPFKNLFSVFVPPSLLLAHTYTWNLRLICTSSCSGTDHNPNILL